MKERKAKPVGMEWEEDAGSGEESHSTDTANEEETAAAMYAEFDEGEQHWHTSIDTVIRYSVRVHCEPAPHSVK